MVQGYGFMRIKNTPPKALSLLSWNDLLWQI